MSLVLLDVMRSFMRLQRLASRFNHHNWISTPSPLEEDRASHSRMDSSKRGLRVQGRNLGLHAIGMASSQQVLE
jgi:hypothetical protein